MRKAAVVAAGIALLGSACGGAPTPSDPTPVTVAPVVDVQNVRVATLPLRVEAWPRTVGVDTATRLVDANVDVLAPLGEAPSQWVFGLADGAADVGAVVLWAPGLSATFEVYVHDTGAPPTAASWSRWHRTARSQGEATAHLGDQPVAFILPRAARARYVWVSFLDGDVSLAELAVMDAVGLEQARAHGLSVIELRTDSPTTP